MVGKIDVFDAETDATKLGLVESVRKCLNRRAKKGLHLTASSVRLSLAPASGSSAGPAFGSMSGYAGKDGEDLWRDIRQRLHGQFPG